MQAYLGLAPKNEKHSKFWQQKIWSQKLSKTFDVQIDLRRFKLGIF